MRFIKVDFPNILVLSNKHLLILYFKVKNTLKKMWVSNFFWGQNFWGQF